MASRELRRTFVFTGISILCHLTIFIILLLNSPAAVTPKDSREAYVEILEHVGASASERVQDLKRQKAKALRRQRIQRQRRLDAAIQKILRTDISKLDRTTENSFLENIERGFQADYKIDLQQLLQKDKFLPVIWQKIRAKVSYRPEHLLAQISGHVRIRAHIDRGGKLLRLMDEEAEGNRELLGWVMLCVAEALKDPAFSQEMYADMTLDLNFHFLLGESAPQISSNTTKMVFAIEGTEPRRLLQNLPSGTLSNPMMARKSFAHPSLLENPMQEIPLFRISTDEIANFFKDRTLKNHQEWDFYAQEEKYKHHCEKAHNPNGCLLLARLYRSIGKNRKAEIYEELAQSSSPVYKK